MNSRDDARYRKRIAKIKAYFAERPAYADVIPLLDELAGKRSYAAAVAMFRAFSTAHAQDPHDLESLRRVTSAFAHKSVVRDIVADILTNEQVLEEIAARSYPHPIGFDKLVLWHDEATGYKLRLHIYWRSPQDLKTELIHLHRFLMASSPVTGEVDNRIFRVVHVSSWSQPLRPVSRSRGGGGKTASFHAYTGYERDADGRLHKRHLCKVELEDIGKTTYIPGQTYAQAVGDAHYVETNAETGRVNNDVCSTVYIHGPTLDDRGRTIPVLFEPEELENEDAIIPTIPNFTVERLRGSLGRYQEILDESVRFYDWIYDPEHGPNLSIGLIAGYLLAEGFGTQEVLRKWDEDRPACERLLRFHTKKIYDLIIGLAVGGTLEKLDDNDREMRYYKQLIFKAQRHPRQNNIIDWLNIYGDLPEQFARYADALVRDYAKGVKIKTLKPVWGLQTLNVRGGVHWGNIRALLHATSCAEPLVLAAYEHGNVDAVQKASGPTTAVDIAAQEIMRSELVKDFPDIAFVGEEDQLPQVAASNNGDRRWLVDPIDATRNFVAGSRNFAISAAHQIRDGNQWETTDGVVSLPALGEIYWAERGEGAFWIRNGIQHKLLPNAIIERPICESLVELPTIRGFGELEFPLCERLDRLGLRRRSTGCTALSLCQVASGQIQAAIVTANTYDVAAGLLIAEEAGAHVHSYSFLGSERSVTVQVVCRTKDLLTELRHIVHEALA